MLVSRLGKVSDPAVIAAARSRWTGDRCKQPSTRVYYVCVRDCSCTSDMSTPSVTRCRSKIPADLLAAIYAIAVASGGQSDYDEVISFFRIVVVMI